jgi:hypothetical protein
MNHVKSQKVTQEEDILTPIDMRADRLRNIRNGLRHTFLDDVPLLSASFHHFLAKNHDSQLSPS